MPNEELRINRDRRKTRFFQDLAQQYFPEMRLLISGGRLSKADSWRNVVEHSLVEIAVAEVLSHMLELNDSDQEKLTHTAAIHDWKKRFEVKAPESPLPEMAIQLESRVNPNRNLLAATTREFVFQALIEKSASWLQKLQYYIDNITSGSEVVLAQTRLAEAEQRGIDPQLQEQLSQRLGGSYWDKERELTDMIESEIFQQLPEAIQAEVKSPDQIPVYIRRQIEKKYEST